MSTAASQSPDRDANLERKRLKAHQQPGFERVYQLDDNITTQAIEAPQRHLPPTRSLTLSLRIQANLIRLFQLLVLFDEFFPPNPDEQPSDQLMVIIEELWDLNVSPLGPAAMRGIIDHWQQRHLDWWKANRKAKHRFEPGWDLVLVTAADQFRRSRRYGIPRREREAAGNDAQGWIPTAKDALPLHARYLASRVLQWKQVAFKFPAVVYERLLPCPPLVVDYLGDKGADLSEKLIGRLLELTEIDYRHDISELVTSSCGWAMGSAASVSDRYLENLVENEAVARVKAEAEARREKAERIAEEARLAEEAEEEESSSDDDDDSFDEDGAAAPAIATAEDGGFMTGRRRGSLDLDLGAEGHGDVREAIEADESESGEVSDSLSDVASIDVADIAALYAAEQSVSEEAERMLSDTNATVDEIRMSMVKEEEETDDDDNDAVNTAINSAQQFTAEEDEEMLFDSDATIDAARVSISEEEEETEDDDAAVGTAIHVAQQFAAEEEDEETSSDDQAPEFEEDDGISMDDEARQFADDEETTGESDETDEYSPDEEDGDAE